MSRCVSAYLTWFKAITIFLTFLSDFQRKFWNSKSLPVIKGADSNQKKFFLITACKPLFGSVFFHGRATRVYWPIFSVQTVFYQFFVTKIFGLDNAKIKFLHKGSKYLKIDQNPNKKHKKKRYSPQIFTERCIYDSLT